MVTRVDVVAAEGQSFAPLSFLSIANSTKSCKWFFHLLVPYQPSTALVPVLPPKAEWSFS